MTFLIYMITSCLLIINSNEASRILAVFPMPSISHQVVFRPLTQELAKRGHEVVVITPDPAFQKGAAPTNLTEIDVHDISYKIWQEKVMTSSRGYKGDQGAIIEQILDAIVSIVDVQLNDEQVKNILHDNTKKFDLILSEACVRPALIYSHVYKVPVIQVSSFGAVLDNYVTIGAPVHPFLYPIWFKVENFTMWDKIKALTFFDKANRFYQGLKEKEHNVFKKHFGENAPSVDELHNNVHMLFLNIRPMFEGIRPVPPSVVYMGGLHQKPDKELPAELRSYLDFSKNGVIYISFGTNVETSLLPPEKIQALIHVVSKLPYDVLWKWDTDELPGRTKNIKISKWLPQSDLLKHPNVKLFVTQGGLQSTDEAITAGVPLIGIPMLGDQWFNVAKYEQHKIGIRIDLEDLTEEKFAKAINTIMEDDSYRRNIIHFRELMNDEPMKPLDRAVWWTEYVLRHGGAKHLRSPAANISWSEYLELELIFTVLAIVVCIPLVFIIFIWYIYKFAKKYCMCSKFKED